MPGKKVHPKCGCGRILGNGVANLPLKQPHKPGTIPPAETRCQLVCQRAGIDISMEHALVGGVQSRHCAISTLIIYRLRRGLSRLLANEMYQTIQIHLMNKKPHIFEQA